MIQTALISKGTVLAGKPTHRFHNSIFLLIRQSILVSIPRRILSSENPVRQEYLSGVSNSDLRVAHSIDD